MATARDLALSPDIRIPLDAVTQAVAILAKRGAGKTYTAGVWAEEMLAHAVQTIILDPMGAYYGLRSSADGKGPGFPIAILGGDHADVPLEAVAGELVANLAVDERLSMILDMSGFSKNERRRFVTDFLERLYHRNRESMHVIVEEADLIAPQRYGQGDERMLGAVFDLVRRGRGRGLGSTLITQRSASLNNEVLEQADILIAGRTTGPADRKAIDRWIDVHDDVAERRDVRESLPKLPTGTFWFWWPEMGVLERARIRAKTTFDSSATPKPGEVRRAPKTLADVDLNALTERMTATIERAKADDPKELRKRVADLDRQLVNATSALLVKQRAIDELEAREPEPVVQVEVDRFPAVEEEDRALLQDIAAALDEVGAKLEHLDALAKLVREIDQRLGDLPKDYAEVVERREKVRLANAEPRTRNVTATVYPPNPHSLPPDARAAMARATNNGTDPDKPLSKYAANLLDTLHGRYPLTLSRTQLALLAGVSRTSSSLDAALTELRRRGLITSGSKDIALTQDALIEYGTPAAPRSAEEIREQWRRVLPNPTTLHVYEALLAHYPEAHDRASLAAMAGSSPTSSSLDGALTTLRGAGLLDDTQRPGVYRAADLLFEEPR